MLPVLFQSNWLVIYSYPLFVGLAWGLAHQLYFSKDEQTTLGEKPLLFWGLFLFSWIGAKAFYLFNVSSNDYQNLSFWLGGGFVFYGGLIGAVIWLVLVHFLKSKLNINHLASLVPPLVFGHSLGRVGCFLAGCCYGVETDSIWGVHVHGESRLPVPIFETIGLIVIGLFALRNSHRPWIVIKYYLLGYGVLRFLLEYMRGDQVRGKWGLLTPSQWISVLLIMTGMVILFRKSDN